MRIFNRRPALAAFLAVLLTVPPAGADTLRPLNRQENKAGLEQLADQLRPAAGLEEDWADFETHLGRAETQRRPVARKQALGAIANAVRKNRLSGTQVEALVQRLGVRLEDAEAGEKDPEIRGLMVRLLTHAGPTHPVVLDRMRRLLAEPDRDPRSLAEGLEGWSIVVARARSGLQVMPPEEIFLGFLPGVLSLVNSSDGILAESAIALLNKLLLKSPTHPPVLAPTAQNIREALQRSPGPELLRKAYLSAGARRDSNARDNQVSLGAILEVLGEELPASAVAPPPGLFRTLTAQELAQLQEQIADRGNPPVEMYRMLFSEPKRRVVFVNDGGRQGIRFPVKSPLLEDLLDAAERGGRKPLLLLPVPGSLSEDLHRFLAGGELTGPLLRGLHWFYGWGDRPALADDVERKDQLALPRAGDFLEWLDSFREILQAAEGRGIAVEPYGEEPGQDGEIAFDQKAAHLERLLAGSRDAGRPVVVYSSLRDGEKTNSRFSKVDLDRRGETPVDRGMTDRSMRVRLLSSGAVRLEEMVSVLDHDADYWLDQHREVHLHNLIDLAPRVPSFALWLEGTDFASLPFDNAWEQMHRQAWDLLAVRNRREGPENFFRQPEMPRSAALTPPGSPRPTVSRSRRRAPVPSAGLEERKELLVIKKKDKDSRFVDTDQDVMLGIGNSLFLFRPKPDSKTLEVYPVVGNSVLEKPDRTLSLNDFLEIGRAPSEIPGAKKVPVPGDERMSRSHARVNLAEPNGEFKIEVKNLSGTNPLRVLTPGELEVVEDLGIEPPNERLLDGPDPALQVEGDPILAGDSEPKFYSPGQGWVLSLGNSRLVLKIDDASGKLSIAPFDSNTKTNPQDVSITAKKVSTIGSGPINGEHGLSILSDDFTAPTHVEVSLVPYTGQVKYTGEAQIRVVNLSSTRALTLSPLNKALLQNIVAQAETEGIPLPGIRSFLSTVAEALGKGLDPSQLSLDEIHTDALALTHKVLDKHMNDKSMLDWLVANLPAAGLEELDEKAQNALKMMRTLGEGRWIPLLDFLEREHPDQLAVIFSNEHRALRDSWKGWIAAPALRNERGKPRYRNGEWQPFTSHVQWAFQKAEAAEQAPLWTREDRSGLRRVEFELQMLQRFEPELQTLMKEVVAPTLLDHVTISTQGSTTQLESHAKEFLPFAFPREAAEQSLPFVLENSSVTHSLSGMPALRRMISDGRISAERLKGKQITQSDPELFYKWLQGFVLLPRGVELYVQENRDRILIYRLRPIVAYELFQEKANPAAPPLPVIFTDFSSSSGAPGWASGVAPAAYLKVRAPWDVPRLVSVRNEEIGHVLDREQYGNSMDEAFVEGAPFKQYLDTVLYGQIPGEGLSAVYQRQVRRKKTAVEFREYLRFLAGPHAGLLNQKLQIHFDRFLENEDLNEVPKEYTGPHALALRWIAFQLFEVSPGGWFDPQRLQIQKLPQRWWEQNFVEPVEQIDLNNLLTRIYPETDPEETVLFDRIIETAHSQQDAGLEEQAREQAEQFILNLAPADRALVPVVILGGLEEQNPSLSVLRRLGKKVPVVFARGMTPEQVALKLITDYDAHDAIVAGLEEELPSYTRALEGAHISVQSIPPSGRLLLRILAQMAGLEENDLLDRDVGRLLDNLTVLRQGA